MATAKIGIFIALGLVAATFVAVWVVAGRNARRTLPATDPAVRGGWPDLKETVIGAVVAFFDTLGIGSFAPTTAAYKFFKIVPDRIIPGTLKTGGSLTIFAQALIFVTIIEVDVRTLVLLIAAATVGAWLGAGIVAELPRRRIQVGMGVALLVAAALMVMAQFDLFPVGGEALAFHGPLLVAAMVGNFILGALMTLGIGMYAPCMIMVSLMGLDPRAAFPIMMGSCAFLMPVASMSFVRKNSYALRPALGLLLGGVPAVLVAAFVVGSLPLTAIRWLVVVVVIYAAVAMLVSARAELEASPGATRVSEG